MGAEGTPEHANTRPWSPIGGMTLLVNAFAAVIRFGEAVPSVTRGTGGAVGPRHVFSWDERLGEWERVFKRPIRPLQRRNED